MIRTIREAELELELNDTKRELAKLQWANHNIFKAGTLVDDPYTPISVAAPIPQTLYLFASVDVLRGAEFVSEDKFVIHARARGHDNTFSHAAYINSHELMAVRDAAEYLSYLHERTMREMASFFHKKLRKGDAA
jgi:hypothetical protein